MIGPNTQLFISVSATPSSFGARVYNLLFSKFGIDAVYIPRMAPDSPKELINAILSLGISGCSVSMPLKSKVAEQINQLDEICIATKAVNTIVNKGGELFAFNTDVVGIEAGFNTLNLKNVLIYGSGAMARNCIYVLSKLGISDLTIVSRNSKSGQNLVAEFNNISNLRYSNYDHLQKSYSLVINTTPCSHNPPNELLNLLNFTNKLFDFVLAPTPTKLIKIAKDRGISIIDGVSLYRNQVRRQFEIYTGRAIELSDVDLALNSIVGNIS